MHVLQETVNLPDNLGIVVAITQLNLLILASAHLAYPVSILRADSNIRHTDLGAVVLQRTFMQRWHIAALKSDLNRIYVQRLQVGLCPLAESFNAAPQRC